MFLPVKDHLKCVTGEARPLSSVQPERGWSPLLVLPRPRKEGSVLRLFATHRLPPPFHSSGSYITILSEVIAIIRSIRKRGISWHPDPSSNERRCETPCRKVFETTAEENGAVHLFTHFCLRQKCVNRCTAPFSSKP